MSFNKVAKLSFVAALALSFANASDEAVALSGVEVTGTGGGVDSIDEIKINTRNATTLKDVMRDIPGVYIRGTNSMNQTIYIRGTSYRGINVTIDGAKQTGNTFHHNTDLFIDPELLKAVDISVGGKSVTSGSLAGSVAFKTVDAKDLLEEGEIIGAKVRMGYGSNNDEFSQGAIVYAAPVEGLDFLAALNHKGYDWGKAGNGIKTGGDGNDLNYLFKVGYSFLDAHRISVSHDHNQYKGQFPLRAEFSSWLVASNAPGYRKYERDTTTLKYEFTPSDLLNLEATAYNTKQQRVDTGDTYGIKTKGINLKAKTKFETGAFAHTLKYGFEYYDSKNYAKPDSPTPEQIKDYAFYLEDAIKFGDLTVVPGIRYEKFELRTYKGISPNLQDYKYKFDKVTPAIALDYEIGKGFGAFASYAKVFQGPQMLEGLTASGYLRPTGTWAANDNLKATTGDAYEFGARYKGEIAQKVALSATAKYFITEYKNLNASYEEFAARRNVGDAKIDGIELFVRADIYNASFAIGYTKQDIKYKNRVLKNPTTYYYSDLLGYRDSGDKYTFNAEYALPALDLLLGYNLLYFASETVQNANNADSTKLPSYSVSDFYVTYAPSSGKFKGLEVNAGLYNAFDKAYTSHSQRNTDFYGNAAQREWEVGRNLKINVSYKF